MSTNVGVKCLSACLAIVGALAAEPGSPPCHAILWAQGLSPAAERLTVRPHEMAIGTQNVAAGEQKLDSLDEYLVYIPKQAVGTRRVPLVVMFGGGGVDSRKVMDTDRELADKYGLILFAPNIGAMGPMITMDQVKALDAGLKQVLRKFAIDPGKIALAGSSNGAHIALDVGCANLDIFSRIAPISPVPYEYHECGDMTRPQNARTSFFLETGVGETRDMLYGLLDVASKLRKDGHSVLPVLSMRPHQWRVRDHDYMWHWLQDTWAFPDTSALPKPPAGDSMIPFLTTDVLTKMTTFWTWIRSQPKSTWENGPKMTPKALTIAVGQDHAAMFDMKDMPTFISKYPSVAAALTQGGLTPEAEERYRAAFIGARVTREARREQPTLNAFPMLEKNVDFMTAHLSEVNTLLDKMGVPRCEAGAQEQFAPGSC